MALNQTSKGQEAQLNADGYPKVPMVSADDIEKNKNDEAALNSDLKLLSSLLGRPLSEKDVSQLAKQTTTLTPSSTTIRSTTTTRPTKTTLSPKLVQEIGLLHQIAQKPNAAEPENDLTSADELAAIDPSDAYGKTNDALLATLLKQRGIGPAHNNLPLNIYPTTSTTVRTRYQTPSRSPRPLLDGLSWLWKTWQDTAPGQGGYESQSMRTRTRGTNSEISIPSDPDTSFDDGLDSDTSSVSILEMISICANDFSQACITKCMIICAKMTQQYVYEQFYFEQQPLDQSHTNGNSGFGFGSGLPGGQLLSAALGMTRAVTQFLGTALQV